MSTFIISPLNSLTYKELDGLLPNFNNTLDRHDLFIDAINVKMCQKFMTSETIVTQARTDFDTVTAKLYDENDNETSLTVTEVSTYTDFSFYEFSVSGKSAGQYRIRVVGTKAGDDDRTFESEPFELVVGTNVLRSDILHIVGYKKVIFYNTENEFYMDYSTGIKPFVWLPAKTFKFQPIGEIDIYNNLDNKEKLEQTNFRAVLFETYEIPRHVALKFSEGGSMDYFEINGVEFIVPEVPQVNYYGDSNQATMSLSIEERFTVGVNSDDEGWTCEQEIIDGGLVMNIGENDLSAGTAQYSVTEGYAVRYCDWALKSGSSATVKVGTTPGGENISRPKTSTVIGAPQSIATTEIPDWDGTGTVYVTKTGVGAVIDFWLTLITYKETT